MGVGGLRFEVMMAEDLLNEWLERLEAMCTEVETRKPSINAIPMLTSIAPPSLWRARIAAIRDLQQALLTARDLMAGRPEGPPAC